jgi:hypothetical protein
MIRTPFPTNHWAARKPRADRRVTRTVRAVAEKPAAKPAFRAEFHLLMAWLPRNVAWKAPEGGAILGLSDSPARD